MTWEDSDRSETTLFFETDERGSASLACNPHAFLLAGVVPALRYGERRLHLDATLCPVLKDGLATAAAIVYDWYYRERRAPLQIEARALMSTLTPRPAQRAGFFFSGGIDSYSTLRLNRLAIPDGHPHAIRDGILVFGLEQDDPEKFEHVKEYLEPAATACGISFVPVYTNVYLPYRAEDAGQNFRFWEFEFEGWALAAVAHSLVRGLSVMSISATMSHRTLSPYGSHPLLDPNYSSSDMRIVHAGLALSRLEKTRLVADWGVPLRYLRVCNRYARYAQGALNCGECEKCVRTKLALLVLDKLPDAGVFSNPDVTPDLVERRVRISTDYTEACYRELVEPLVERGHREIARMVKRKLGQRLRGKPSLYTRLRKLSRIVADRASAVALSFTFK
jgi:hypothetical protein